MSKDKYVIANCPALFNSPDGEFKNDCCDKPGAYPCKNCTDCVLKQIVEYCVDQNLKYDTTACDILDILDIREVDDDA